MRVDHQAMGLNLHDAYVKAVRVIELNYAERSAVLSLDTSGSMAKGKKLCLLRCSRLEMDDVAGCWWMGETLTKEGEEICLQAELSDADGNTRRLYARCRACQMK